MDDGLSQVGAGVAAGSQHCEGEMCDGGEHGAVHLVQDGRTYEGQCSRGVPHGVGKFVLADGTTSEGEFSEGQQHGRGKEVFADGDSYEGEFVEGVPYGVGKLVLADGTYEGEWSEGNEHGKLVVAVQVGSLPAGTTYEGEFVDDAPHGVGTGPWPVSLELGRPPARV